MKVPQDETPNGLRWGYLVALQGVKHLYLQGNRICL